VFFSKFLFNDTARGYTTAMVRMMAGTHYPSHKQAGVEELYLLDGDPFVDDMAMRAGDYCCVKRAASARRSPRRMAACSS
jgi:ChrR Cupin-like domain